MHQSALVATIDSSDEISFTTLPIAGTRSGEYLIRENEELKTVEEIEGANRAVRPMWPGERITDDHREELTTRLLSQ